MNINEITTLLRETETKNIAVVDVRTYEERAQIPVPNSLHIPIDELPNRLDEVRSFDVVYFFCRAGRRAEIATQLALSQGIKGVTIPSSIGEVRQASEEI